MPRSRSIADRERDHQAVEMRRRGASYRQIATALGMRSPSSAYDAVERALTSAQREANAEVRQLEIDRLDDLRVRCWQVLGKQHLMVNQGRVMTHPTTGEVLTDDMPRLQAIDRLLKISERYAKLLGLDAPLRTKVEVMDGIDSEIERLVAELAGPGTTGKTTPDGTPGSRARGKESTRTQAVAGEGTA